MRIICTVEEFANLVRGCHDATELNTCNKCALYKLCYETDGNITQYVTAADIVEEETRWRVI